MRSDIPSQKYVVSVSDHPVKEKCWLFFFETRVLKTESAVWQSQRVLNSGRVSIFQMIEKRADGEKLKKEKNPGHVYTWSFLFNISHWELQQLEAVLIKMSLESVFFFFNTIANTETRANRAPPGGQIQRGKDEKRRQLPASGNHRSSRTSPGDSLRAVLLATAGAVHRLHGGSWKISSFLVNFSVQMWLNVLVFRSRRTAGSWNTRCTTKPEMKPGRLPTSPRSSSKAVRTTTCWCFDTSREFRSDSSLGMRSTWQRCKEFHFDSKKCIKPATWGCLFLCLWTARVGVCRWTSNDSRGLHGHFVPCWLHPD